MTRFGTSTRELAEKARADPVERASFDPSLTGGVAVFEDGWHRHALKRCQALVAPNTTVPADGVATIMARARLNSAGPTAEIGLRRVPVAPRRR